MLLSAYVKTLLYVEYLYFWLKIPELLVLNHNLLLYNGFDLGEITDELLLDILQLLLKELKLEPNIFCRKNPLWLRLKI